MQSLAIWAAFGLLLSALEWGIDTWAWWCMVALFWAVSRVSQETGRVEGMIAFIEMSEQEQNKLRRLLQEAKED